MPLPKTEGTNFRAPIPGMSLTAPPKARPWQKPPQITNIDEAVKWYLPRLGDAAIVRKTNKQLEMGTPVDMLVDMAITSAMMQGIHTLELGMLVSPVIRELIVANAEIDGVDYYLTSKDKLANVPDEETMAELRMKLKMAPAPAMEAPVEEPMAEEAPAAGGFMQRPTDMMGEV